MISSLTSTVLVSQHLNRPLDISLQNHVEFLCTFLDPAVELLERENFEEAASSFSRSFPDPIFTDASGLLSCRRPRNRHRHRNVGKADHLDGNGWACLTDPLPLIVDQGPDPFPILPCRRTHHLHAMCLPGSDGWRPACASFVPVWPL